MPGEYGILVMRAGCIAIIIVVFVGKRQKGRRND